MIKYPLNGSEFIPLCELLKSTSVCETGGNAKHAILNEEVLVDGVIETRKRFKIRENQQIQYDGKKILVVK